ncbi:MAG: hypothetical protein R3Y32_06700 [Bacillota bacterium]
MKSKIKNNKKILLLLVLTLVIALTYSLCVGFTYAEDTPRYISDDYGIATTDIVNEETPAADPEDGSVGDITETSYDIGQATYEYDDIDADELAESTYAPVISPTDSVTITASVVYSDTAIDETGYLQIIAKTPSDTVFANYDEVITVADSITSETSYTGSYTFSNLEAGEYEFMFMFYTSADEVDAVYSVVQTVMVSGSITEMSTISSITVNYGSCVFASFTHEADENMGTLAYNWYIDDEYFTTTEDPEIDICNMPVGEYVMYCNIVPEVGVATKTNSFNVTVLAIVSDDDVVIVSPTSVEITEGENATVMVDVSAPADSTISYIWYVSNVQITDVNNSIVSFSGLSVGEYSVYCVVTVDGVSYETDAATITVIENTSVGVTDTDTDTDTDADADAEDEEESTLDGILEFLKTYWLIIGCIIVVVFVIYKKKQ